MMNNWILIQDLVFFQEGPGVRKSQFRNSGVKLLNVGNINNNKIDLSTTEKYISKEEAYGKYEHFLIDEGDLLIACSGIVVSNFSKKIAFIEKRHLPLCLNTSTMRFKSLDTNTLEIRYFFYFLMTHIFNRQLGKLITGSAQLNFGPSHIKKIKMPLIDIDKQKTIAKTLDKAKELIALRKASIEKLDELSKSVFIDMFGDPVENPKGFLVKQLDDFFIDKKNGTKCGPFGSALKKDEYVKRGIPVWNMDNISKKGKFINSLNLMITREKFEKLESYAVCNGDIIISRAGTVGKMCVVDSEYDNSIISTNLIRLRLDSSVLLPLYFVSLMIYCKDRIKRLEVGSDGALTHMSTKVLKSIEFPYPPLDLQQKFAKTIQKVETQKALYEKELVKLEENFEALLAKSFG